MLRGWIEGLVRQVICRTADADCPRERAEPDASRQTNNAAGLK
jgi:hypothetical protein